MKKIKLTLVLTVLLSMIGLQAFADFDTSKKVQVGVLYYYLDDVNYQAAVTYRYEGEYAGSITIPSSFTYNNNNFSVTIISFGAFMECSGLTSIEIPNSVTSIGTGAFHGCSGLTSVTIPNSVTSIGSWAFEGCSGLTSVTIPNSIKSIYDNAFSGCSNLTSVTLNLNFIVAKTYTSSENVIKKIFGEQVTEFILGDDVKSIGDYAFYGFTNLTSITVPNSVTSIGSYAFYDCSKLSSFTIPNNVTSIDDRAFYGCSSLTSVTIPNSVTSIGESTFSGCSGLTSVTIPNSLTSIGESTFSGCSGLTSVNIPNSVTSIGSGAFQNCSGLTAVSVSDVEKWSQISFGNASANPLYYAKYFYQNGEEVTKLNLANDVSNYAFINCESLTEVDVKGVGTEAFKGCPNITSVKVDCPTVENWFADSKAKVQTLTLGENVTTINSNSFDGFNALKTVSIGSNVAIIGAQAFANCQNMVDVYCYAVRYPNVQRNTFENSYIDYVTLHVPAESVSHYKAHEVWGKFKEVVPIEGEETAIERVTMMNGTDSASVIYNMNGQRISKPAKGLNIINGRQVVIK